MERERRTVNSLHPTPFLDQFCERTYMESEDLENDPLETKLGCVAFGKLLYALKGACSLLEECCCRITNEEVCVSVEFRMEW